MLIEELKRAKEQIESMEYTEINLEHGIRELNDKNKSLKIENEKIIENRELLQDTLAEVNAESEDYRKELILADKEVQKNRDNEVLLNDQVRSLRSTLRTFQDELDSYKSYMEKLEAIAGEAKWKNEGGKKGKPKKTEQEAEAAESDVEKPRMEAKELWTGAMYPEVLIPPRETSTASESTTLEK